MTALRRATPSAGVTDTVGAWAIYRKTRRRTSQHPYRVYLSDMSDPIYFEVWFYGQRGAAEKANNDGGLAARPSGRSDVNGNPFQ